MVNETYVYDLYSKDGTIYLFGINDGRNTVLKVTDFRPWFVVELPTPNREKLLPKVKEPETLKSLMYRVNRKNKELVKDKLNSVCKRNKWSYTLTDKFMSPLYYANRPESLCLLVEMETSDKFYYLRKVLSGLKPHEYSTGGFGVHEIRTPTILQFGCVTGINTCGWIKFRGVLERSEGRRDFWECSVKHIKPGDATRDSPVPTVMYYDIESYTSNIKRFPDPELEQDVMFQVSVVLTGHVNKSYLLTLGKPGSSRAYKTLRYESEAELIVGFCKLIQKHDPNLITGYNIHGFDWRYILTRASKVGVDAKVRTLINMLPDKVDIKTITWSTAQMGEQKFIYPEMFGRISFDLLPYVRREFSKKFRRYKLDIVAEKFLGSRKDPITPVDIHNSYKQSLEGDYSLLKKVGKYCVKDSELVRDLFAHLDIWSMLTQSSIVMNIRAEDLYIKGQQIRIYCQVYRYCFENKILIDESSYTPPEDSKYEGACVLVPQPGMYRNVVPFDFCLTGDTTISLLNGTSVRLDEIQGGEIVSSCVEGCIGSNRVVGGLQQKGVRDTVKICLSDGTEIISTPDHKFLLEDGSWCEAQSLGGQRVTMGVDYPLDSRGEDEVGWSLKLDGVTFTMTDDRNKILAFSRLLGLVLSDGSIYRSRNRRVSEFSLGTEYDSQRVMDDIELICGKRTTIVYRESSKLKGSTFRITPPAMLSKMFHSLDGIVVGKRVTQPMRLPVFLTEKCCPKSVIREFLGGLFGGDGVAPCMATKTMSVGGTISFKWATLTQHTDSMKRVFRQLNGMLDSFGITSTMSRPSVVKYHSHPPADVVQNQRVNHQLNIPKNCIERFSSCIGFRYCINKTAKLDIITRYLKFCRHVREQNGWVVDRTNQLISEKIPNLFSRSKKYPSFQDCLDIARSELKQKEAILHEYSLSSVKDVCYQRGEAIRHADNPRRVSLSYKKNFPTLCDFITQLGVDDWFSVGNTKKYAVSRTRLTVPSYSMKVVAVRKHTPQPVYDIEVASSHNFVANGAVAHNCSLYPTIIVAYNICYSTLVVDESTPDDTCHVIEWTDEHSNFHRHRFIKSPMGVIPNIIQNLLNSRAETKKELKKVKDEASSEVDPEKKQLLKARAAVLDARQLSFKISANSMYGGMGVKQGYLPCREAASSITAKGRQELMNAKRILENHFDARVIYGDTDSCYVVFDDYKGDDLFQHSKQIDAKINKNNIYFPWPMVLEFEEEVYRQFLILKKKCYMWRTDHSDEVGKKGGMLVRRDVSRFEQMVYENVTDMIFQDATLRDITCYIMEQFNRCCGGDFPDELFTISSSVKDVKEYKVRELPQDDEKRQARLDRLNCNDVGYQIRALPAPVQLAQRMRERGTPVDAGERIEYLLTTKADHNSIQADRIEEFEYFSKHKGLITIDYVFYLSRLANNLDELIDTVYKIRPRIMLPKRSTKILWTMKRKDEKLVQMCARQFKVRVHWNKVMAELKSYFLPRVEFQCPRHQERFSLGTECNQCR